MKTFLTAILIILLAGAAFLVVRLGVFSQQSDPYKLVPATSIFVFETKEPVRFWNTLVAQELWHNLSEIPALKTLERQLVRLDSLAGSTGALDRTWKGQPFLVSLHPVARDEFDFLFTVGFEGDRVPDLLRHLEGQAGSPRPKARNYSGVTLWEVVPEIGTRPLTYALFDNVLVASFTSFLVEDAIRTGKSSDLPDFKAVYPTLFSDQSNSGDILRVTGSGLASLIKGIAGNSTEALGQDLEQLEFAANVSVSFGEGSLSLTGHLMDGEGAVNTKANSDVLDKDFFNWVSNRTGLLRLIDISALQSGGVPATRVASIRNTLLAEIQDSGNADRFFRSTSPWAILMDMERSGANQTDRAILVKTKNQKEAVESILAIGERVSPGESTVVDVDTHLGHKIYGIGVEDMPLHLYRGIFGGFDRCYLIELEGYMVLANSLRTSRNYLDDLYNDNTWGKDVKRMQTINELQGFPVFLQWVDLKKFYSTISASSSPTWASLLQKYAANFGTLSMFKMQWNGAGDANPLSLSFDYGQIGSGQVQTDALTRSRTVNFNFPVTYGPVAVRNFNDRSVEYLVQDERNTLYLIGSEGDLVFSRELEGAILGDIHQIDYYDNDKLQMAFSTSEGVYVLDRLGNLVPGFPLSLPEGRRVAHFNVVDYDGNKDYRFFIADRMGDLFLLGKEGQQLEGWNPKRTTGPLVDRPSHHRVSGLGDVMVSLHENGNLELFNRRGESRTGASIRIGDGVATAYGITDRGGASAAIVTVNIAGEVVSVNFRGELTYRTQLLRPDRETKFHVVNNQNKDDFLLVMHEFNKVTVLNANESPLFEYSLLADELEFQWFSFGYRKDVFAIFDRTQEFVYLFDMSGNLLTPTPIDSTGPVSVHYATARSEFVITVANHDRLVEYKLTH